MEQELIITKQSVNVPLSIYYIFNRMRIQPTGSIIKYHKLPRISDMQMMIAILENLLI